jgi:hypothetical protein
MIVVYVDTLDSEKTFGLVVDLRKIERLINLVPDLKTKINSITPIEKLSLTITAELDPYAIVYQKDFRYNSTIIYVMECNYDFTSSFIIREFKPFTDKQTNQIKQVQNEIKKNIKESRVFLTDADPDELPTNLEGIYSCNVERLVIKKAKELEVLYEIENVEPEEGRRSAIADECLVNKFNIRIVNMYCFIHRDHQPDKKDNGYMYIKWRDLINNFDKIEQFEETLKPLVGDIDRAILLGKIDKYKMNE